MNKHYRIHEFDSRVGKSQHTVRRWGREDTLTATTRSPSGKRHFDEPDVRNLMGDAPVKKDAVVYCWVSSAGQKDDLVSQISTMETYSLSAVPVDILWLYRMRKYKAIIKENFPEYMLNRQKDE